jgi:phosphate starvation-inducible membrane PsiE
MGHLRLELAGGLLISTLEAADFAKWFNLAAWFTSYVRLQQVRHHKHPSLVVVLFASCALLELACALCVVWCGGAAAC